MEDPRFRRIEARDHGGTFTEGVVVGTPQYMAPEQVRNAEIGPPADMYALGAIAYRALTGHQPFPKRDVTGVLASVLISMPIRPSALARVPREVDLVLALAMAKEPKERFETGETFAMALDAARVDAKLRRRASDLLKASPWLEAAEPSGS